MLAVPPYRTTWGATPYEEQVCPEQATVASKLAGARAVLVAKLSVGALAWGDVWFGGNNLLLTNLTGHPCVARPSAAASSQPRFDTVFRMRTR